MVKSRRFFVSSSLAAAEIVAGLRAGGRVQTSRPLRFPSLEVAAGALEDFDLVPVRVLDEEELAQDFPVLLQLHEPPRLEASLLEALALGLHVLDGEGDVPVAVAEVVGFGLALVQRELQLEFALGVAEVDQGEVVEVYAVRLFETEGLPVKRDRPVQVEDPDHAVYRLCHASSFSSP